MTTNRPLRVFLCHSSNDKPAVRELYQKLRAISQGDDKPWIEPWLDEEDIFPGDDWNLEIQKAIRETDAIIVCLSKSSITKEGYVQKEIKTALDYSDEKPERTVYIIPIRLEECQPPERLKKWQYADYFEGQRERGFERLLISLKRRANSLGLKVENPIAEEKKLLAEEQVPKKIEGLIREKKQVVEISKKSKVAKATLQSNKIILSNRMEFIRVPAGKFLMGSKEDNILASNNEKPQCSIDIPYNYWMARYPVTNELYNEYIDSEDLQHPVNDWEEKKDHPVVNIKWTDAVSYCQWLNDLLKPELPTGLMLRLPTEAEWEKAARGTDGREYPWGKTFDNKKCNTREAQKGSTTPVGLYSQQGDSPYGCADMAGNVWEWTRSLIKEYPYKFNDGREDNHFSSVRVLRGGSYSYYEGGARCATRSDYPIDAFISSLGFRVAIS